GSSPTRTRTGNPFPRPTTSASAKSIATPPTARSVLWSNKASSRLSNRRAGATKLSRSFEMDFSAVARLAGGYAEAQAIQAALELGVFEVLRNASTAAQLAGSLVCDPRAMELLLDALVSIGLLNKTGSVYALNGASSTYLVKNSPKYLGGMIAFDASLWDAWGRLAESVRTGKPARAPDM